MNPPACLWCGEPVLPTDEQEPTVIIGPHPPVAAVRHYECAARFSLGSFGHQMQLCSCYGGDFEDPPQLSKRDAARLALALANALCRRAETLH